MADVRLATTQLTDGSGSDAQTIRARLSGEHRISAVPRSFFERIVDESLKVPARLWRDVFDHLLSHDHAGHLARIASPTLLLWGEQDALFPREDQDRLARTIPGARLTIYPRATARTGSVRSALQQIS